MAAPSPGTGLIDALKGSARSPAFWSFVAAVAGIAATIIGGVGYFLIDRLTGAGLSLLVAGLILLFIALVLAPREIASFIAGRQGRYGVNIVIMTAAFFIIVILINFLFFRSPTRIDVTATRVFNLAPQTVNVLRNLDGPVRASAFFTPADANREQAEDLLNEFSRRTNNFQYRFIDPELNRSLAVQYDVQQYPAIVFEDRTSESRQGTFEFTEQSFVTGILVATGVAQKQVAYLTGHKEPGATRDLLSGDVEDEGFDFAIEGLERDNYGIGPLNLSQFGSVPDDVAVLLIVSPQQDLSEDEAAALTEYLRRGGNVVALLDPNPPQSFVDLLTPWGVSVGSHGIADAISNVAGQQLTPLVQRANGQFLSLVDFGITNLVDNVFFPDVTATTPILPPADMPSHVSFSVLARTTPASWLETDPERVEFQPGIEQIGPFPVVGLLVARGTVEQPNFAGPPAKVIVFGDSDFARNKFFFSNDNADFFLNSVNWLAEDQHLISIRPKVIPFRELVVNTRERDFIKWSSWLVPPWLMILMGAYVWWRRR